MGRPPNSDIVSGDSKQGPYSRCESIAVGGPPVNSVSVVVTIRMHVRDFNDCGCIISHDGGYSSYDSCERATIFPTWVCFSPPRGLL